MSEPARFTFSRRIDGDYVTMALQQQGEKWVLNGTVLGRSDRIVTIDNLPEITKDISVLALTILRHTPMRSRPCSTASHLHLETVFRPWAIKNTTELAESLILTVKKENTPLTAIVNELISRKNTPDLELLPLSRVTWLGEDVVKTIGDNLNQNDFHFHWLTKAASRWSKTDFSPLMTAMRFGKTLSSNQNEQLLQLEELYLAHNENIIGTIGNWLSHHMDLISEFCEIFLPSLLIDDDQERALLLLNYYISAAKQIPEIKKYLEIVLDYGSPKLRNKICKIFPDLNPPAPKGGSSMLEKILYERYTPQIAAQNHIDVWQTVLDTYIPLKGSVKGEPVHTDFQTLTYKFLEDDEKRVALIHGDLGSGKTTFCRHLGQRLLDDNGQYLPIFINANRDIDADGRWKSDQQKKLKKSVADLGKNALLIIDSFDELKYDGNIWTSLELNTWGKSLKVIITGRPQRITNDASYRNRFAPVSMESSVHISDLAEYQIQPFDDDDINRYLIDGQHSKEMLNRLMITHRQIRPLLRRPFALAQFGRERGRFYEELIQKLKPLSLSDLLDSVITQRLKREEQRIYAGGESNVKGLYHRLLTFNQRLAFLTLSIGESGVFELPDSTAVAKKQDRWKPFVELHSEFPIAQKGALYTAVSPGRYAFLDQSLLGYFGAQYLFQSIKECPITPRDIDQISLKRSEWVRNLLGEMISSSSDRSSMIDWLKELPFVADTKEIDLEQMSGNALSILTGMRVPLSRLNMEGCKAQGAYLGGAVIDGSDWSDASFIDCDFNSTFIRNTKFKNTEVTLQEKEERGASLPLNSSLGEVRGLLLKKEPAGSVSLWDRVTEQLLWKHSGDPVTASSTLSSINFANHQIDVDLNLPTMPTLSPISALTISNEYIVTGHGNGALWIWKSATAQPFLSLISHQRSVTGVGFLTDRTLASADGQTLILWKNGQEKFRLGTEASCLATFDDLLLCGVNPGFDLYQLIDDQLAKQEIWGNHGAPVTSVAFARNGNYFSAGSTDGLVTVWETSSRRKLRAVGLSSQTPVTSLSLLGTSALYALSSDGKILRSNGSEKKEDLLSDEATPLATLTYTNGKVGILQREGEKLNILTEEGASRKMKGLPIQGFAPSCASTDGKILALGGDSLSLWDISDNSVTLIWRTNPELMIDVKPGELDALIASNR